MKTLEVLRKLEKDLKETHSSIALFITGGFVRDLLRRKRNKDLDIVARNVSLKTIQSALKKYGPTKKIKIHHVPGTEPITCVLFRAEGDTMEAQIAIMKAAKGAKVSLKQDSKQRDFTINAMYLPINEAYSKNVIDFWGGKNDIESRQILSVGSAKSKFIKSPIRILRAFSLACKTRYTITQHVQEAISDNANLLKKVPAEAIKEELIEIIMSSKPSQYLKMMQKLGVLKVILPELDNCVSCTQDKRYHKHTVFNHLAYTCDYTEPDLVLRLAGLLHDIGKPVAKEIIGGKITFHKHEVIGARIAAIVLKRLRFDNKTIDKVVHLVRMHMYHYTREYTDAGVRRFINGSGITKKDMEDIGNFPLFKLRKAERLGNGYKTKPVTPRQKDFENRLIRVYKSSNGLGIPDLVVDGNDLIEVFSMKPSKEIGVILRYLLEKIIEIPELNNRSDLLHCALDFVEKRKDKTDV